LTRLLLDKLKLTMAIMKVGSLMSLEHLLHQRSVTNHASPSLRKKALSSKTSSGTNPQQQVKLTQKTVLLLKLLQKYSGITLNLEEFTLVNQSKFFWSARLSVKWIWPNLEAITRDPSFHVL